MVCVYSGSSDFILHICQELWTCEAWACSSERMGRDVLPAGSHRLTATLNKSSSILAGRLSPVMQKQRGWGGGLSNNVCWRRRAEAITENTFRQIANMRSKVTVESEGSNITAIWLIATKLVTVASHRQRTNSVGEQRGGEARGGKQSMSARWSSYQCTGVKNKLHSDQCLLQEPWHLQAENLSGFRSCHQKMTCMLYVLVLQLLHFGFTPVCLVGTREKIWHCYKPAQQRERESWRFVGKITWHSPKNLKTGCGVNVLSLLETCTNQHPDLLSIRTNHTTATTLPFVLTNTLDGVMGHAQYYHFQSVSWYLLTFIQS